MGNAEKIQVVINTIETLTLPGTYDNSNRLMGIYRMLAEVRDDLQRQEAEANAGDDPTE